MLICLSGPKGSGKDTAAQPLLDVGFTRINFADELKWLCAEVFDFSPLSMESQVEKERPFDQSLVITGNHLLAMVERERINLPGNDGYQCWDVLSDFRKYYLGIELPSLRALLQWIGTAFREQVCNDFWINIWREKVLSARANLGRVVCTDMRYANERQAARDIGGVLIYISRPGCGSGDSHASENDFGNPEVDYNMIITNDGDIQRLQNRTATDVLLSGGTFWQDGLDRADIDALHLYYTGRTKRQED